MKAILGAGWLISLGLCACHSTPTLPVPVSGSAEALAAMAGEWDGSYDSEDGTRSGAIDFHLRAGSDTAFGDVLMIPQGWDRPLTAESRAGAEPREGEASRLLTIRFVHAGGGWVTGELDRYRDPDCGCLIRTVFEGHLVGDSLTGRYRSFHQDGTPPRRGTWRVTRKVPAS